MKRSITRAAVAAVAAAVAVTTIAVGAGAADAGHGSSVPPPGSELRGEAAVRALGSRASSVASQLDLSRAELESTLLRDRTLSVDSRGQLLVTEPPHDQALSSESAASWSTTPPYAVDRTFRLHSRPESRRTIYLDFTGHTMVGTLWNTKEGVKTITLMRFDVDGDLAYSAEEHALMQNAYLSVSEDFAPFDVDVTTEDPGAAALSKSGTSDLDYGRRVVITPTDFRDCDCGGEAFVDTFEGSTDTPAYVVRKSPKGVAEAISHEVGHTLGLLHDGLTTGEEYYEGHGDWGPIMGSSFRRLTQWSKGEYEDADNPQDDLQVIKDNGLSGSVADRGGTPLAATALPIGSQVVGELINFTRDVDAWKITSSKSQTVTVRVENTFGKRVDTNLDARIRVLQADGTSLALTFKVIATASPSTTTGATLSLPVVSGTTYYIYVDGVGYGSPSTTGYSNYGSIGRYNLSVSTPLTPPKLVLPPLTVAS